MNKNKAVSVLLTFVMIIGLFTAFPMTALAADEGSVNIPTDEIYVVRQDEQIYVRGKFSGMNVIAAQSEDVQGGPNGLFAGGFGISLDGQFGGVTIFAAPDAPVGIYTIIQLPLPVKRM